MHPIRSHIFAHTFIGEPSAEKIPAHLGLAIIDRTATIAVDALLIGGLVKIGNALDATTESAAAACFHEIVMINDPALIWMLSPDFAPIAAVAVPYINRVPPTVEFQILNPTTVAAAAVAVATVIAVLLVIEPCGEFAAAILTVTRVL